MAAIQELTDRLALYKDAERRILTGAQEASLGGQRSRQAELKSIQDQIKELETRIAIAQASQGGPRVTHSVATFRGRSS